MYVMNCWEVSYSHVMLYFTVHVHITHVGGCMRQWGESCRTIWRLGRTRGSAGCWRSPPALCNNRGRSESVALKDAAQLWCPSKWNGLTADKRAREEEGAGDTEEISEHTAECLVCFQSCRGASLARSDVFGWSVAECVLSNGGNIQT